ncbi:hypothetical protein [Methylobacterium oryzisoli]
MDEKQHGHHGTGVEAPGPALHDLADDLRRIAAALQEAGASPALPERHAAPESREASPRPFGALAGRFRIGESFFDPLTDEDLRCWEEP